MIRKLLGVALLVAVIAAVANFGRLRAVVERWDHHQDQQHQDDVLEHWDEHVDAALTRLQEQLGEQQRLLATHATAARRYESQAVDAEARAERYDELVSRFVTKLKLADGSLAEPSETVGASLSGQFEFAGRQYDISTGQVQAERYLAELRDVRREAVRARALEHAEREVALELRQALTGLNDQVAELRTRAANLAMERDALIVREQVTALRTLARDNGRAEFAQGALKEIDELFALAENDCAERRARLAVSVEIESDTLGLEEAATAERQDARQSDLQALYREYWAQAGHE